MASACVNQIPLSPEKFLDGPVSFPWLSPRISKPAAKSPSALLAPEIPDPDDFEFRLEDPVNVLPADELFSGGKLMPLHTSGLRQEAKSVPLSEPKPLKNDKICRKSEIWNAMADDTRTDMFSPRAPRCSSRWKDLLGLKKLNISNNPPKSSSLPSRSGSKSLKMFLHRSSKSTGSTAESSLSLPLLSESDFITSGRLSLSSSTSSGGYDHDSADLPRHSLDFDKFRTGSQNPPRVRLSRHRTVSSENPVPTRMRKLVDLNNSTIRGISVDSPRMNASGRVIFQGLERSSSSPSSFNNGPRMKYKGMERSYSANVRVTPVLNVPVCSLIGSSKSSVFGFQMFPNNPQKGSGGTRGHIIKTRAEKP